MEDKYALDSKVGGHHQVVIDRIDTSDIKAPYVNKETGKKNFQLLCRACNLEKGKEIDILAQNQHQCHIYLTELEAHKKEIIRLRTELTNAHLKVIYTHTEFESLTKQCLDEVILLYQREYESNMNRRYSLTCDLYSKQLENNTSNRKIENFPFLNQSVDTNAIIESIPALKEIMNITLPKDEQSVESNSTTPTTSRKLKLIPNKQAEFNIKIKLDSPSSADHLKSNITSNSKKIINSEKSITKTISSSSNTTYTLSIPRQSKKRKSNHDSKETHLKIENTKNDEKT